MVSFQITPFEKVTAVICGSLNKQRTEISVPAELAHFTSANPIKKEGIVR